MAKPNSTKREAQAQKQALKVMLFLYGAALERERRRLFGAWGIVKTAAAALHGGEIRDSEAPAEALHAAAAIIDNVAAALEQRMEEKAIAKARAQMAR